MGKYLLHAAIHSQLIVHVGIVGSLHPQLLQLGEEHHVGGLGLVRQQREHTRDAQGGPRSLGNNNI